MIRKPALAAAPSCARFAARAPSAGASAAWRVCAGSAGSEAKTGGGARTNQDAVGWTARAGGATLAVSDGHGAAAHFRSERGARAAVARIVELLPPPPGARGDARGLIARLLLNWRRTVDRDIAADPLAGAPKGYERFTPYGATLIALGVDETGLILIQIGDGEAWLGYPDGRVERPFNPDGLTGQRTYSLCLPGAARYFRALRMDGPTASEAADWPDFALLVTDGVTRAVSGVALARALREQALTDWPGAAEGLDDRLAALADLGGDDATACMALRSG